MIDVVTHILKKRFLLEVLLRMFWLLVRIFLKLEQYDQEPKLLIFLEYFDFEQALIHYQKLLHLDYEFLLNL